MGTHPRDGSQDAGLVVESPFVWRARRKDCRHRLICFPHAGGGAGAFSGWAHRLPPGIELVAVQLPGRQNRVLEEPATEVGPLVRDVMRALRPLLAGPFSLFGHSCGALLAFEVAQALGVRGGPRPAHLFLSGESSPRAALGRPQLHRLSQEEFRARVLSLGGFDEEVTEDEDALEILLPLVMADFRLWERHRIVPAPRLDVPVTVLVGDSDVRAPLDSLDAWRGHTNAEFDIRVYPGGHFYLFDDPVQSELLDFIARTLLIPERESRAV
ncbi:thioesterase II family protein [Streptomyces aurantiogriseus]|uniref:Thioesterase n=1 Tax=Streptomyces aurantiogriseus TaxID=66870 RepID=A0A918FP34_9ACTN|nr:alpha/beta fold hydrolase [Streptomyces aurantiogriseus]GGR62906.1 thioesterase [Streptomyces aurantiogriseus]